TFIGSEPGKLALSDNGQYLCVVLDGAAAVRRFDLTTQLAGLQLPLGNDPLSGPYYADDLQAVPGSPGSVAVSRGPGIVAIYDDGVKRASETTIFMPSITIAFSNSPATLYGTSGSALYAMSADGSGVKVTNSLPIAMADIKFDDGRIYAGNGP